MKFANLFSFRTETPPSVVIRTSPDPSESAGQSQVVQSFSDALTREWLETNGLGGWAGSTLLGAHSRRYHGLLVAAESPSQRWMVLSRLDETLETGKKRFELGCNQFPGVIHPRGDQYFERFELKEFPQFFYRAGPFLLKKSVLALHGRNAVIVSYELLQGPSACILELRPFVAGRDIHTLTKANDAIIQRTKFDKGLLELPTYPGVPSAFIRIEQSRFTASPAWHYRFQYPEEQARGFDFEEDLFSHGTLEVALFVGQVTYAVVSTAPLKELKPEKLIDAELERRQKLAKNVSGKYLHKEVLTRAADQFLVKRGEGGTTILAGYPWFTDWGRDTMIAIPGLCLVTKRFDEARSILGLFKAHLKDGLIPNRFPDGSTHPEYNTVDASLWLFETVWKYFVATGDREFVLGEMLPALKAIIQAHQAGTSFGIRVEADGLLRAGDLSTQLTWMDAKVHGMPVTPRFGKPIEINALWCNALSIFSSLCKEAGDFSGAELSKQAYVRTRAAILSQFWDTEAHGFADVLVPNAAGGWTADRAFRPNQVIALGLNAEIVPQQNARALLERVRQELLMPIGLRSLSSRDAQYVSRYEGAPETRDRAYHQGTVWPWLIAPYLKAVARYGSQAELKSDGAQLLQALGAHLSQGGLGSVSEILDGDPPFTARGCPFQAWSVGAVLECLEILGQVGAR
jgi:predicted glycogen debranching enzyme